jgi:hypothetical protein
MQFGKVPEKKVGLSLTLPDLSKEQWQACRKETFPVPSRLSNA